MFIRMYVKASSCVDAEDAFWDTMKIFKERISTSYIRKNEAYWKIEGLFEVEVSIEFKKELSESEIELFLNSISDSWQYFGNPVNEALSSRTMQETRFANDSIELINVLYND